MKSGYLGYLDRLSLSVLIVLSSLLFTPPEYEGSAASASVGPTITDVIPSEAHVGDEITIIGTGFGEYQATAYKYSSDADIDDDQAVDASDLAILEPLYGSGLGDPSYDPDADIDLNDVVGFEDYLLLLESWMSSRDTSYVEFENGAVPMIISWSDTEIVCTVPYRATSGEVHVITDDGTSNGVHFSTGLDYYVDKADGSRGNPGTRAAPFQDIDECADLLQLGDTCWIKNGVYDMGIDAYMPTRSGKQLHPITFSAYPGHRPLIRAANFDEPALGVNHPRRHLTYSGFEIRGTFRIDGERDQLAVGIVIERSEVYSGSYHNDGNWTGVYLQDCSHCVIRNNDIHHVRIGPPLYTKVNGAGIRFYRVDHSLIEHNWIHGNADEGIYAKEGTEANIYRWNLFEGNRDQQIKLAGYRHPDTGCWSCDEEIYENIFNCGLRGETSSSTDEVGVWVHSNNTGTKIYNNTFVNCDAILSGDADWYQNTGWDVYNNIFYRDQEDEVRWLETRFHADNNPAMMDHNLYWIGSSSGEQLWIVENYRDGEQDYTSLSEWRTAYGAMYGQSSLAQDPLFVDAANGDFHLLQGSPARLQGLGGEDLGAYPRDDDTVIGLTEGPAVLPSLSTWGLALLVGLVAGAPLCMGRRPPHG